MTVDRRLLVPVVLAVVLAGCATGSQPRSAATARPSNDSSWAPPPADLTATVVQYRKDAPQRVVQIKFSNGGGEALEITLLRATLPGYETMPGRIRTNPLKAGRRVDLPTRLGAPTCDRPVSGTPTATLRVVSERGQTTQTTVPIADDDGLLERLRRYDCDVERVEAAVDLELSDTWQKVGAGRDTAVRGRLTASLRPGTRSMRITDAIGGELLGLTVLTPEGDPALPVELEGELARADLDLDVVGSRCDGHAVAESQRLMRFSFWVSVDGEPPVVIRRSPDVAGYRTLVAALLERCGLQ